MTSSVTHQPPADSSDHLFDFDLTTVEDETANWSIWLHASDNESDEGKEESFTIKEQVEQEENIEPQRHSTKVNLVEDEDLILQSTPVHPSRSRTDTKSTASIDLLGSPVFKNRQYVLNKETVQETPKYYETAAYQRVKEQIHQIMNDNTRSSKSKSDQLYPLLLAQIAQLESMLKSKSEEQDKVVSKHLDFAAEGIREQSHLLHSIRDSNEQLLHTQHVLGTKIQHMRTSVRELTSSSSSSTTTTTTALHIDDHSLHSSACISDTDSVDSPVDALLELFFVECKQIIVSQAAEIVELKQELHALTEDTPTDHPRTAHDTPDDNTTDYGRYLESEEEEDDDNDGIDEDDEKEDHTQLSYNSLWSRRTQHKLCRSIEESGRVFAHIEHLLTASNQHCERLVTWLEHNEASLSSSSSYSLSSSTLVQADEVVRDVCQHVIHLHAQLHSTLACQSSSQWLPLFANSLELLFQENADKSEKIRALLEDNQALLSQCEQLCQETITASQVIEHLQRASPLSSLTSWEEEEYPRTLNKRNTENGTDLHHSEEHDNNHNDGDEDDDDDLELLVDQATSHRCSEMKDAQSDGKFWKQHAHELQERIYALQEAASQCSCYAPQSPSNALSLPSESSFNEQAHSAPCNSDSYASAEVALQEENRTLQALVETTQTKLNETLIALQELQNANALLQQDKQDAVYKVERAQKTIQHMVSQIATMKVNSNEQLLSQKQAVILQLSKQRDELLKQGDTQRKQIEYLKGEKKRLEETLALFRQNISSTQSYLLHTNKSGLDVGVDAALLEYELETRTNDVFALRDRLAESLQHNKDLYSHLPSQSDLSPSSSSSS